MKHIVMYLIMIPCVAFTGENAFAQQKGLIDTVARGCLRELETYCKDVTSGEGRVLHVYTHMRTSCPVRSSMRYTMPPRD